MTKGKKMYWHIVTWASPSSKDGHAVGDVIGYEERTTERYGYSSEDKGFFVKTALAVLGTLPADYHEKYPDEARARLDLWKSRFLEDQKAMVNTHDL